MTKRETTEDEWFFTYPVDDKIGDQMEPLEPGITSDSRSGWESSRHVMCLTLGQMLYITYTVHTEYI